MGSKEVLTSREILLALARIVAVLPGCQERTLVTSYTVLLIMSQGSFLVECCSTYSCVNSLPGTPEIALWRRADSGLKVSSNLRSCLLGRIV